MQAISNLQIAALLDKVADFLEFKDENQFKIRAYRAASDAIEDLGPSVAEMAKEGGAASLQGIAGIGKTISLQILEIVETGDCAILRELRAETPETVLDLIRVSGIGLRTARILFKDFGIKSLHDLKSFADGGGLTSVPGLGEKTSSRILRSLERITHDQGSI